MNNCRWVLTPAKIGVPAVFCERPVRWTMERDDDNRLVRKYNAFCDEHEVAAALQEHGVDQS